MVKHFTFIAFFMLALQAASLLEEVRQLLPAQTFTQNHALLRTLFSNDAKYRYKGRVDYRKLFQALERVGVLKEAFAATPTFTLTMRSTGRPLLLMRVGEWALERGNIYRYQVLEISYAEDVTERFKINASQNISFAKLVSYLEKNSIDVVKVEYGNGGWSFILDLDTARVELPKVIGSAEFRNVSNALWLDVCGASSLHIHSFNRYWHPFIGVYDSSFRPLDLVKEYGVRRDLRLPLPNGACYIKISDIFTPKNIKRGFRVTLE